MALEFEQCLDCYLDTLGDISGHSLIAISGQGPLDGGTMQSGPEIGVSPGSLPAPADAGIRLVQNLLYYEDRALDSAGARGEEWLVTE